MSIEVPILSRSDRGGQRPYDLVLLASGGVDSAVGLATLAEAGLNPFAVTLVLPHFAGRNESGEATFADAPATAKAADDLCQRLGVSNAILDLRELFQNLVIDPFVTNYRCGLTPNPCVRCNPDLKFGFVRRWAMENLGVRILASGHYAGLVEIAGKTRLARVHRLEKDQSYFLYRLPPADLPYTRFPLSSIADKDAVRAEARRIGLPVAEAADSMDICFLPEGDYRPLVAGSNQPGPILDVNGREIGRHDGCINFTIGQRKGFKTGFGKPMYVLRILAQQNAVVIGPREEVGQRVVAARDLVVHDPEAITPKSRVMAKIRSGGHPHPAEVIASSSDSLAVGFDEEVFAPAPGQHLVLYDDNGVVLGGGEIVLRDSPTD